MSASRPGTMRGPQVKTPLPLLLLLLLTPLLRTVSCQDDFGDDGQNVEEEPQESEGGTEDDDDAGATEPSPDPDASSLPEPTSSSFTTLSSGDIPDDRSLTPPADTDQPPEEVDDGLGLIIIIILVALVAVIIAVICGIFMHRRLNQKVRNPDVHTEDPYFEGSSTEKVPMPMFEEDVPSVLEVEMDDLDQWMKKDGDTAGDS
ncbi:transmembrane protein 154 isoform X2 [Sphaeramia orbicularis]|uniref:transmembrane protein 154 isoform X2 n=1 Tax=Sphaeramia orbicularis TaxID=375764 RepID=UPI00117E0180|nr:transmembrane protein 154 isoform X2 [Sphaeramia orbicularis]